VKGETVSRIRPFERSMHTADRWVADMSEEIGETGEQAYGAMRAVLHVLRDRLPHDESAHLAAQLPTMVRGVYYEGWRPSRTPERYHDVEGFLDRVAGQARMSGFTEAAVATEATMCVLRRHVSEGELADVLDVLPAPIRGLLHNSDGS